MKSVRLDELLLERYALPSLDFARALILEGRVLSGGRKCTSAGERMKPDAPLRVLGEMDPYVSRGAHKLKRALEAFSIDVQGKTCLDVGASTGGFTDVMLRAGAKHVYAVDVGYNLLDYRLRSDARVTAMERTNARFLTPEDFPVPPEFGATDVSFISLKAVLPAVLGVFPGENASFVALIKPQFEAPKELVGEKGVVRDFETHCMVVEDLVNFVPKTGWHVAGLDFSPITGPEGNIEFLLYITKEPNLTANMHKYTIFDTINAAYDKLIKSSKQGL